MSTVTTTLTGTAEESPQSIVSPRPKQPDIQYHPSYENFIQRRSRRLAENPKLAEVPLPDGFPQEVSGPIVWEGKDWKSEGQWVYKLSGDELKEIDDALEHFKSMSDVVVIVLTSWSFSDACPVPSQGLNIWMGHVGKDNFPLPTLSPRLHGLAQELYSGRGFFVLRTIPIDKYSRADLATIYAG